MNGSAIPVSHGFPVRAIVPGHYGMASVKWLTHIHAVKEAFQGYWQTSDYAYWKMVEGRPNRMPLSEMHLKSQIAKPGLNEILAARQTYTISGAAWAGETEVTEVAVSDDGGSTWLEAEFIDPPQKYSWRRWRMAWVTPGNTGKCTLMSRARDANGNEQPKKHDENYGTYVINHLLPIEVMISG